MEYYKSGNPSDLTVYQSPSIPKDFPKELIPKDICEKEYFQLYKCQIIWGAIMMCQQEYQNFEQCKGKRKWEIEHFKGLTPNQKPYYLMGLDSKLSRLNQELQLMPSSFHYWMKRKCYQSDIDQITWRLKYLKKIQMQNDDIKKSK